jgi:hypothetical protein
LGGSEWLGFKVKKLLNDRNNMLKLATPNTGVWNCQAKRCSSQGKNSEWSANIQLVRIGLVKVVDSENAA